MAADGGRAVPGADTAACSALSTTHSKSNHSVQTASCKLKDKENERAPQALTSREASAASECAMEATAKREVAPVAVRGRTRLPCRSIPSERKVCMLLGYLVWLELAATRTTT